MFSCQKIKSQQSLKLSTISVALLQNYKFINPQKLAKRQIEPAAKLIYDQMEQHNPDHLNVPKPSPPEYLFFPNRRQMFLAVYSCIHTFSAYESLRFTTNSVSSIGCPKVRIKILECTVGDLYECKAEASRPDAE